jgi:hypothetical protein
MIRQNLPDIGAALGEGTLRGMGRRQTGDLAVHKDGGEGQLRRAPEDDVEIPVGFVTNS